MKVLIRSRARDDRVAARRLALLLMLLTLALVFAVRPAVAAETVMVDGVPHVKNGDKPANGIEKLKLKEIWRHGGEDDEDVLFGSISDCRVGKDGNIYLLDSQLNEVKVFSPTGEVLPSLGREGEGPGEFRGARQIVFLPDGTLGVAQLFPGKLVGLNLDGTPAKDIALGSSDPQQGGFFVLINALSGGGNLVLSGMELTFDQPNRTQKRHMFVRSYGMDGKPVTEYATADGALVLDGVTPITEKGNDFVWRRIDVSPDGHVVMALPRDDYELSVYAPDGKLERVIDRKYETWTRDERTRQRFQTIMDAQVRQLPPGTKTGIEDTEGDIQNLRCAADGSIWVLTSRAVYTPKPGCLAAWDVFSPTGEFTKQVEADVPGDSASDWLFVTDAGYAIQLVGFWDAALAAMGVGDAADAEAKPMQVICYKIES